MKEPSRYYEIRYPIPSKTEAGKKHWLRIGSATGLTTGHILCSVEAVPVDWNGELHLFPSKKDSNDINNINN